MSNFNATDNALNQNLSGALGQELALMAQRQRVKELLSRSPIRGLVDQMAAGGMNQPELPPFDPTDRSPIMANGYAAALGGQGAASRLGIPMGYQQGFTPATDAGLSPLAPHASQSPSMPDVPNQAFAGAPMPPSMTRAPEYQMAPSAVEARRAREFVPPDPSQIAGATNAAARLQEEAPMNDKGNLRMVVPEGQRLMQQPWAQQLIDAQKILDQLPLAQQRAAGLPGIQGPLASPKGARPGQGLTPEQIRQTPGGMKAQAYLDQQQQNREARRFKYAQTQQDLRNGVNPAIRQLLNDPLMAGGGMNGGMMNPLVAALQFGGDAMGHVMQGNAAMAQAHAQAQNGALANQIALGNQKLQERMVDMQTAKAKQEADAAFGHDYNGDVARVQSLGGWKNMTPDQQRVAVLHAIGKNQNSLYYANEAGDLAPLGINVQQAYDTVKDFLPPHSLGWIYANNEEILRKKLRGTAQQPSIPVPNYPVAAGGLGVSSGNYRPNPQATNR